MVGVLNATLRGRDWLVGIKCTYADLSFAMWNNSIAMIMKAGPGEWDVESYPNFKRWQEAMMGRDSLKKVMSVMAEKEVSSEGKK